MYTLYVTLIAMCVVVITFFTQEETLQAKSSALCSSQSCYITLSGLSDVCSWSWNSKKPQSKWLFISSVYILIWLIHAPYQYCYHQVSCIVVAALLHYLFLAAFCWMLCEGVMMFLLLVVVFSKLSNRWWFFLLIGYGKLNDRVCTHL